MKTNTLNLSHDESVAAGAIGQGLVAACGSVVAICAISATGESLFSFLGAAGELLARLIGI